MSKDEVREALTREPFVPLRLHLTSGKIFDIPFRDVARLLSYGVLVFIGLKEGTRQAKSFERFVFDQIERIDVLTKHGRGGRRKRAS